MGTNRREFMNLVAGSIVAGGTLASIKEASSAARGRIKAIAFDGLAIIDPRPVFAHVEELFPGKGAELSNAWRTRQFEYTWLRTLGGQYVDFWQVIEEALIFAVKMLKLDLSVRQRDELMQTYLTLKAWPDAAPALKAMKEAGIHMAFLSNFTSSMLDAAVKNSALEGVFEDHLSTDRVRAFKPDSRAYRMGLDAFRLKREEIIFAAFAGWDVAGAKWFGYPTYWVNRLNSNVEELGAIPDGMGANLLDLARFLEA